MIKAQHKKIHDRIFNAYISRLFKKHFYSLELFGDIPEFDKNAPLLLLPNHSTWWDGFFVYLLNKNLLHRTIHMMMLQEQLEKNPFFRHVGAYSIDHRSRYSYKSSLLYTLDILREESLVCIFPQGELGTWYERPIHFQRGIDFVLKKYKGKLNVGLLGIRVELLSEQRPQVFFQFDRTHTQASLSAATLSRDMEKLLDTLHHNIQNRAATRIILAGKQNINKA